MLTHAIVEAGAAQLLSPHGVLKILHAEAAPGGNTVLFFGATSALNATLVTLFGSAQPGSRSVPAFLSLLQARGLPVTMITSGNTLSPPPPPVGQATSFTQDMVMELDIPFTSWLSHIGSFNAALQLALASLLHIQPALIYIPQILPGLAGGARVYLDVTADHSSSDSSSGVSVPHSAIAFAALFGAGNGFTTAPGDAASPALVAALQAFGLPATRAWYINKRI